jgi:hypothetical protein
MKGFASVPCRVWVSGFLSRILDPAGGVANGINNLDRDCRECRVREEGENRNRRISGPLIGVQIPQAIQMNGLE